MGEEFTIDEKTNALDSLEAAAAFIRRQDDLRWKWVCLAIHDALYGFCILSLSNGGPVDVTESRESSCTVQFGDDPPLTPKKEFPPGRTNGPYRIRWERACARSAEEPFDPERLFEQSRKRNLIGFWTAIARIQDSTFWMSRYTIGQAIILSDQEMTTLEILHRHIRNQIVHFRPLICVFRGVGIAVRTCLRIIDFLVFSSNTILVVDDEYRQRVRGSLDTLTEALSKAQK